MSKSGPDGGLVKSWRHLGWVCRFKNEKFKLGKCFTIFKNRNDFMEFKEGFIVKPKIFSID